MFAQWLENLKLLIGDVAELPSLTELRQLFERGLSEIEAWAHLSGECVVYVD